MHRGLRQAADCFVPKAIGDSVKRDFLVQEQLALFGEKMCLPVTLSMN